MTREKCAGVQHEAARKTRCAVLLAAAAVLTIFPAVAQTSVQPKVSIGPVAASPNSQPGPATDAPPGVKLDGPLPANPNPPPPGVKADEVAKAFHDFCLKPQQSLAAMEAAAASLGAAKLADKIVPLGANRSIHQETFLMRRLDGVYQLTAMDGDAASGPNRALGCALSTTDTDGLALSQSLTMGAGLGSPDRRIPPDSTRGASVMWARKFGQNDGRILLSYGAPDSRMVSIHLILPNIPR